MKKKYLLLSFVIICALGLLNTTRVNSKIVFPPPGYCGDPTGVPSFVTCASSGCHGGNPQAANSSNLALTIGTDSNVMVALDSNFKYGPAKTYFIKFNVLDPGYVWGFQMAALTPTSNNAGAFTIVNSATERLSPATPTIYISHLHANHNTSSWIYEWTSPAADSGAVTFYYAYNSGSQADFNAAVPDSNIFAGTTTIRYSANAGVENISNYISELQVYPNPITSAFGLSFDIIKAGVTTASIYSVDGKFCRQLFNENLSGGNFNRSYDISTLAAGIYLVKLNINGATVTKKIVKE